MTLKNINTQLVALLICMLSAVNFSFAQTDFHDQVITKTVAFYNDTVKMKFVDNKKLFLEKWDTLPQPRFWSNVICLSPDSCIINVAGTRQPLHWVTNEEWKCQLDTEKESYRSCLKQIFGLDTAESIYVTTGKKDFYEYKKVLPLIGVAADVFVENGVDPWYAQTILLIESPGKVAQKSSVGAYGPFQLMKNVGKKYGLKITNTIDERTDLKKAAGAASKLLGLSFIPRVKSMLEERNIPYHETDLWFRLLVMHAYHAGPGNVSCVINELNPSEGGISLFRKIWRTECGGFKNESQNYSQIALASIILFDRIINQEKDTVFMVQGDRLFSKYKKVGQTYADSNKYLDNVLHAYASDLVEGSVSVDYFVKKVGLVQKEIAYLDYKNPSASNKTTAKTLPLNEDQFIKLGDQLLRKKKVEEAIKVYKLNAEQNPNSPLAYDSLSRAYKILGKDDLALKYTNKSAALKGSGGLVSE